MNISNRTIKHFVLIILILPGILISKDNYWKVIDTAPDTLTSKIWRAKNKTLAYSDSNHIVAFYISNDEEMPNDIYNRYSSDGGNTWQTTFKLTSYHDFSTGKQVTPNVPRITLYPKLDFCITFCDSLFYYSTDTCKTWKEKKLPEGFTQIKAADLNKEGLGMLILWGPNKGVQYFKTTNYFMDIKYHDVKLPFYPLLTWKIVIKDTLTYYSLTTNEFMMNFIFKTTDGGLNWSILKSFNETKYERLLLRKIYIANDDTIYVGGDYTDSKNRYVNTIMKTINSGKDFDIVSLYQDQWAGIVDFREFAFSDSHNGVALLNENTIALSRNGGDSWDFNNEEEFIVGDLLKNIIMPTKDMIIATGNFGIGGSYIGKIYRRYRYPVTAVEENNTNYESYPNPISSGRTLNIKLEESISPELSINLYNSLGNQILIDKGISYNNGTITFKIPEIIVPGLYLVRIDSNGKNIKSIPVIVD